MKAKLKEIVKVKRYKRPKEFNCVRCANCLMYVTEGQIMCYCRVEDKYHFELDTLCPFKEQE